MATYALATAALARLGIFKAHPQRFVAEGLAVESHDCRAGLVALHIDRAEPAASTGKDISCQFDRTHGAVLREELADVILGDVSR